MRYASHGYMPAFRLALLAAVLGAGSAHGQTTAPPAGPPVVAPLIVTRLYGPSDSASFAAGRGTLRVVTRSVDDPTQPVGDVFIALRAADAAHDTAGAASVLARVTTDGAGVAAIAPLPATRYLLEARRIGVRAMRVPVELRPGCTVVVEMYVTPQPTCLFSCPTTPPRATLTTCAFSGLTWR
jgi:hypothetical protein